MRTVIGVTVAAAFVAVACATPAARPAANSADGPYPLVIIDGVKRPDLPPTRRYTRPVVVETTTTPSFRITYRGPTAPDTAARNQYPRPEDVEEMQMIDAPPAVALFGPEARYGAVLYYTKKYRAGGGAIIAPTEGSRAAKKAAAATPATEASPERRPCATLRATI